MRNYITRLLRLLRPRRVGIELPEPDGWLANAILRTLRQWDLQHAPGVLYLTSDDITHLAKWASDLQRQHKATRRWAFWQRVKVHMKPVEIR